MTIKRYGVEGGRGAGGQHLPFARATEAAGWLYVSGQVPRVGNETVSGGIVAQSHQAIRNVLAILEEAGYGPQDVVRCGVWLDDARDFASFNSVFREYFGEHPPARACVVSSMVVDCKVEVDCIAYKAPAPRAVETAPGLREALAADAETPAAPADPDAQPVALP